MSGESAIRSVIDGAQEHIWPDPDMSVIDNCRKPQAFPLESFGGWQHWIEATAQSRSCPVDYVAVSLLSALSAVIGNSRWASAWDGWAEPPVLWAALIGNPSSGKSPGNDAVLSLVREVEEGMATDFQDQILSWETDKMAAKEVRTAWEDEVKIAVKEGTPPPIMSSNAIEPEKPIRPRITITDATIESIARLLSQHLRGLLLVRDELSGWLESFNRYSNGGDKPFWIETFGGRAYRVDRQKNDEPLHIPFLSISVVGGIQPDKLDKLLMHGDDDGLTSRILMAWPDRVPPRRPTITPDNNMALTAMKRLHGLHMGTDEEGNDKPIIIRLEDKAASMMDQWRTDNAKEQDWHSGLYLSHLGKMDGVVLRLSLILEYMHWAMNSGAKPEPEVISARSFAYAAALVSEYFLPMAERAYGDASRPTEERHAAMLARQILKRRQERINAREIKREWKLQGMSEAQVVNTALEHLVEANWLDPAPSRSGDTAGRQKSDFLVNPKVWRV